MDIAKYFINITSSTMLSTCNNTMNKFVKKLNNSLVFKHSSTSKKEKGKYTILL